MTAYFMTVPVTVQGCVYVAVEADTVEHARYIANRHVSDHLSPRAVLSVLDLETVTPNGAQTTDAGGEQLAWVQAMPDVAPVEATPGALLKVEERHHTKNVRVSLHYLKRTLLQNEPATAETLGRAFGDVMTSNASTVTDHVAGMMEEALNWLQQHSKQPQEADQCTAS